MDTQEIKSEFKELREKQSEILSQLTVLNNRVSDVHILQEKVNNLEKNVDALEHVLWGVGGENGLRSNMKLMENKMDKIEKLVYKSTGAIIAILVTGELILKFL